MNKWTTKRKDSLSRLRLSEDEWELLEQLEGLLHVSSPLCHRSTGLNTEHRNGIIDLS